MNQAMAHLLHLCYQRCAQLMPDLSEASNLLQKQILKILYAYIQVAISNTNYDGIKICNSTDYSNELNKSCVYINSG